MSVVNIRDAVGSYVYIGRGSRWGNPYSHLDKSSALYKVGTREEAVASYRLHLWGEIKEGKIALPDLAALDGKTLGCYCAPKLCHGEVLSVAAAWAAGVIRDAEEEQDPSASDDPDDGFHPRHPDDDGLLHWI